MSAGYVYIVHGIDTTYIKVGKTTNLPKRLADLAQGVPFSLRLLYAELVHDMDLMEKALKARYASWSSRGEWFELSIDALAQFPPYAPRPETPRAVVPLRIVPPKPTLRERIIALLKRRNALTARNLGQCLKPSEGAVAMKDILEALCHEGIIQSRNTGRTLVFSLTEAA